MKEKQVKIKGKADKVTPMWKIGEIEIIELKGKKIEAEEIKKENKKEVV